MQNGMIDDLITQATSILKNEFHLRDGSISFYLMFWRRLKRFMTLNDIKSYDCIVGRQFLTHQFGSREYKVLTHHEKKIIRSINMLNELQSMGKILPNARTVKYEGVLGEPFCRYLDYKKSNRMSSGRLRATTLYLHEFYLYLQNSNISMAGQINQVHILGFIRHMDTFPPSVAYSTIGLLKDMFHFFYDRQILDIDYSGSIPRGKYIKQAELPSTYSATEISSLLASVNRASPVGKRDYAIIVIAARIGLRSSDISNLQFSNLRWDNNLIVLTQQKTGREITLPLLPEIGNAIIDYLKYGRPQSTETFIFLQAKMPYSRMFSKNVYSIVRSHFQKAGICTENKRRGPHALRHSLSKNMLEKQTMLPVVSEVLGHAYTSSTKFYLRIDLNSLRQCVLDVPSVSADFYSQKEGVFYE